MEIVESLDCLSSNFSICEKKNKKQKNYFDN